MFSRHISRHLAAHADGELSSKEVQRVEEHLAQCERCRRDRDQIEFGMASLEHLPAAQAPEGIWTSIEAALPRLRPRAEQPFRRWLPALAAFAIIAAAGATVWMLARRTESRWEVVETRGTPSVGAKPLRGAARVGAGEWIETDSSSSATVKVGEIGSVEVAPNTRLRVVALRPGEHRLALARGEIYAKIFAPPRLFYVDTPSGTAVDLGCEYSLHTDEDGSGVLQVTRGWVSFQWKGIESLVPAGASCRTRPGAGPGIPYFDDVPEALKQALEQFGVEKASGGALESILREARVRDTLTLWHLFPRVARPDRERVYDRIAALTPVPAGILRENVLKLDADTLTRWKDELAWTW